MKKLLILLIIALAAGVGWWLGRHEHAGSGSIAADGRKVLYYQSPMHPWVKSDKPGRCTICGMELSAVYEGGKGFDADSPLVTLSTAGVVSAGVETAAVTRQPILRTFHVAGTIDDDATRHRKISATVDGRVEKLFVNYLGAEVTEGQPLALLYSPSLRVAFSEYQLVAQQPPSAQRDALLAGVRDRLLRLGLSPADIDALRNKPSPPSELQILAPATGTVVATNVFAGQYVKEGDVLFEIGDFSKMWFVFDAYERDLTWIRMGDTVEITTPSLPGKVLKAPITFIDPTLNNATRSAKIRVVLDNPLTNEPGKHRHELLHRLYAEGRIRTGTAPTLTVPRTAVLWPAGKPIVYVEKSPGVYEPRDVQVGVAGDELWEIAGGLGENERVVTAGNLLLDGQSQINRPPKPPTERKQTLTETQRKAALDFFAAVASLGETLAADKAADFRAGAGRLGALATTLGTELGPRVERLTALAKLPEAGDLPALRAAFYPLSEATAALALDLRREDDGFDAVKVFACDMAKGAVPSAPKERGHWIQFTTSLRNPWWGAEMLECGAEVRP